MDEITAKWKEKKKNDTSSRPSPRFVTDTQQNS